MKVSFAILFSALAVTSAQDSAQTIKDQLMEYREASFVDKEHVSLEFIKEHHNMRMAKLEEMIADRKDKVRRHNEGIRRLAAEEYDRFERQARNFERKLEQMKKRNNDEHHMEHLEDLKSLHNQNRLDYVDYTV